MLLPSSAQEKSQAPSPTAKIIKIPSGPLGVTTTLEIMRSLVRTGKKTMPVRQRALAIVRGLPQKDYRRELERVHAYVRDHIRYVKDVNGVETLQSPEQTLYMGQGDCDDKSILAASLLEAIGFSTRFRAIGFRPKCFSHVLVEAKLDGKWIPVETTEPVALGWQPLGAVCQLVRHN